jgi:hypothetical protein
VEGIDANAIVLVPDPHKTPLFAGVSVRL